MIYFVIGSLYIFADHSKLLQKFYCKIGWHCHEKDYIYKSWNKNLYQYECQCKWCGFTGKLDEHGKLY